VSHSAKSHNFVNYPSVDLSIDMEKYVQTSKVTGHPLSPARLPPSRAPAHSRNRKGARHSKRVGNAGRKRAAKKRTKRTTTTAANMVKSKATFNT